MTIGPHGSRLLFLREGILWDSAKNKALMVKILITHRFSWPIFLFFHAHFNPRIGGCHGRVGSIGMFWYARLLSKPVSDHRLQCGQFELIAGIFGTIRNFDNAIQTKFQMQLAGEIHS